MSQKFIDEVRAIVLSNFSDEKFGVSELASAIGLSTSQTLRKVKAETGKSVTQYIRELRLEKAAKLIKKTDHTIAEISYQVGFSSASYFNKTFSKYYGVAPGEYKFKSISLSELAANKSKKKKREVSLKTKIFFPVVLVLLFAIGYLLINNSATKNSSFENSIAVLPFKDFSPEDSQWFSDGVSDNILHSLAQMKDLSVISFTSSSTFRDSEKTIPVIAEELGVSYILEGSVTLVEGRIKVIAQLIGANDEHIWSKEYNESFDDIIAVQNNVAQEVMQQLKSTLTLEEQTILKKLPTENMEAYNLYLEGRRANQSVKNAALKKNIENNQKAIALDSNFVDAYVELAASKLALAIKGNFGKPHAFSAKEAMTYIDKALAIDPNSARGNAVKARLLLGYDRSDSEAFFKKALALNPNDAESRHWYAKYLLTAEKPNVVEALKQATIANKLNPFSTTIATRYAWLLILNKKYNEAKTYIVDYGFLLSANNKHIFTSILMSRKNKDYRPVFDWAFTKMEEEPERAAFYNYWASIGYNQIFINKRLSVDFAKKAYELDANYMWHYCQLIAENGFLKEAEQFIKTTDFNSQSERPKAYQLWEYYYYKKDYEKANNIIKKNADQNIFGFLPISRTYAQLGYRKKLDSINKLYFVQGEEKYFNKAFIHAILKERDSMYYNLNKLKYTYNFGLSLVNGKSDFDPYRNEERYKTLLREQYIPTEGEQYIPPGVEKFFPAKRE